MNSPYITTPILVGLAAAGLVLFFEAIWLGHCLWKMAFRKKTPRVKRHHWVLHTLAAIGLLCILYAVFVEPYWHQITVVRLETPKLQNAVLRIVQISDLHCDPKARLEPRLPELVNGLEPDVIVFTGDAINSPDALPLFQRTLAAMDAPLGKFAVRGNWDYLFDVNLFENTGFEELPLDVVRLEKDGDVFMLCGISYHNGRISQRAFNQLDPATWNVLLYHSPDFVKYLTRQPIDLFLSGHTHGGQIALPFYGALTTMTHGGKQYEAGLYAVGKTMLYVNRGIGMGGLGPRVRFFARPEITLFEIRPAGNRVSPEENSERPEQ